MKVIEKVSVRELQHKLSNYLDLAKIKPLLVTKYGGGEIVLINPKRYKIVKSKINKKTIKDLLLSPFIGMHKHRQDWKNKSSVEIANELRKKAWYGE